MRKPKQISKKELVLSELRFALIFELELECEKIENTIYEEVFEQTQDARTAGSASSAAFFGKKEAGLIEIEKKLAAFAKAAEAEEKAWQEECEDERTRALKRAAKAELNRIFWELRDKRFAY